MLRLRDYWKAATEGWLGFLTYGIVGIFFALVLQGGLGVALDTDLPIVTISSGSMIPTLNIGDISIVKGQEKYEIGDIIVFDGWRDRPIIHRIVMSYDGDVVSRYENFNQLSSSKIVREYDSGTIFVTKGDNNLLCDQCNRHEFITVEDIHGRHVAKVPYLGLLKIFAVNAINFVF